MQKRPLIERLWEQHNTHCDLAIEAKEQRYDVAYQYHKDRAKEYLSLIDDLTKQKKGGESDG